MAGTISTLGYFLTIITKIAKVIGITKATMLPTNFPPDKESPIINNTPDMAKMIAINVCMEIFSFKKR